MHGTFRRPHEEATIDLSQIEWEIVVIKDPQPSLVTHYRVTSSDRLTGTIIGSFVAPARPDGGPPPITVGDIVESIGNYRIASIYVEIEGERLRQINRHCIDRARRRDHGWLHRVPHSVLAEYGLGPSAPEDWP
jgi:hypothetical protein